MSSVIQQGVKQGVRKATQTNWTKSMITDRGNWPIIGANLLACALIGVTAFRKLAYHPDIGISKELRFSDEVQNETATRLSDAVIFREQSKAFARILYTPTKAIMKFATGYEAGDKWNLTFLKTTDISLPLEQTDDFDDGLFEGIEAKEWAKNDAGV